MNPSTPISRRRALQACAVGTLSLPRLAPALRAASSPARADAGPSRLEPAVPAPPGGLRLGVATRSLHTLSVDDAIKALQTLRIFNAGVSNNHIPFSGATEEVRALAGKFHSAGIAITGSGVIKLPNDETALRRAFENARAAKLATLVCKPEIAALPLVERFAREYDQRIAIHNHGPQDKLYPTAREAMDRIHSLDARIGLCLDVGHTARTGANPAEHIRRYAWRIYEIHLNDSVAIAGAIRDMPVEVGAGRLDIPGILQALLEIDYRGVVEFEYEKTGGNPLTGLAESIGYVRGVLAAWARE
jgi:sugar phosphate isomerase/epimerase